MRWLKILLLLILLLLLPVKPVLADTSAQVTVTAIGWVADAPSGFVIYYISDYELGISWVKGAGANNTMIRAKYGSYPEDRFDGYLVYYGTANITSDTGVNLEETASTIYYRGWSENSDGVWTDDVGEGFWESIPVTLLALLFIPVALTVAMFVTRERMLGFPCVMFWAVLGGYAYTQSNTPWGDWQFYLAFASLFGMTIFTALAAFGLREKLETIAEEEMEEGEGGYIDEGKSKKDKVDEVFSTEGETEPSRRTKALRERAEKRRTGESKPRRRFRW